MDTPASPSRLDTIDRREVFEVISRRRLWLGAPFLAVLTLGSVGAFLWPDTYVSVATFRVVPPAASGKVIPDVFNVGLAERVAAMEQSILSRNNLAGLIETYRLYPGERGRLPLEDVVEKMRRDISVSPVTTVGVNERRHPAFRVAFSYPNRFEAYRVTQYLTDRFLHENRNDQGRLLDSVNHFLREEFDRSQAELQALEARLAEYRRGRGQTAAGMSEVRAAAQLQLLDTRASAAQAGIARARQESILLQAELRAAQMRMKRPAAGPGATAAPAHSVPAPPPAALAPLEAELDRLLSRYKPIHPDVVRLQSQIEALRLKVPAPATTVAAAPEAAPVRAAAATLVDPDAEERLLRAEAQLRAKELEIGRLEQEAGEATRGAARLSATLATTPDRAAESDQLIRDHELALQRYGEARRKLLEGEGALKGNLWNLGETIELVDAPGLPESPVAPNRAIIVAMSCVLGLAAGLALVWLGETGDEAIRSIRQLSRLEIAKVLGSIPLLESDLLLRRRRRMAVVGWASASLVSLASIAGAAMYHHFRQP